MLRQDSFDPAHHSSFYTEKPSELPSPESHKDPNKGEPMAYEIDKPAHSQIDLLPSRVEFATSQARLEPSSKQSSMHDKMAKMMMKTLNHIEEENPNRNHRIPSMAEVSLHSY